MNRLSLPLIFVGALLTGVHLTQGVTVKPNVAPVVTTPVAGYQQYFETTRVIDLTTAFKDSDASAAVNVTTVLGAMNFTLDGETAPGTVANFLNYVNTGRYYLTDPTNGELATLFFHRSATNFVIQSGGFVGTVTPSGSGNALPTQVVAYPLIQNEPFISNSRGTIAMAKIPERKDSNGNIIPGTGVNSATSQWFINLADNSGGTASLDTQNGGFTVFGRVAGSGMTVADAIAALPKFDVGAPFSALPLRNFTQADYDNGKFIKVPNLVSIPEIAQISPLRFSASSNNPGITVSVSGTNLLVTAFQLGAAQINVTATDLDGAIVSRSFNVNVITAPGRIRNISTRANFPTGNEALTGGFIVRGGGSQRLVVRAIGPSSGVSGALDDPTLELLNGANQVIATNNNWTEAANAQELIDLGIAPGSPKESAILLTVPSQAANITTYTARMKSANGKRGIGLVEIYDIDSSPGSTFRNISTLGPVGTGSNELAGGFILRGNDSRRLVVRAIGPSLTSRGIQGALVDPTIKLVNNQGMTVASNNDWQTHPDATEIQQIGVAPENPKEAAVIATLPAGEYTATVAGNGGTTGNAQVEVYQVQ